MQLHSNAKTVHIVRAQIRTAKGSLRDLAARFGVSTTTIRRWKGRGSVEDASSRPKEIKCSVKEQDSERLLDLRRQGMSLDDIFETVMDEMSYLTRSALYRFLKRHGLGKLPSAKREPRKTFKEYEPGYIHIDTFYLPKFAGKRSYCFVAIDRATRRTHVMWSATKSQQAGAAFLRSCLEAFEFKIEIVLTDNGTEFTNKAYAGPHGKASTVHAFDKVCKEFGIKHRLTKPRTPKTNGLVERQNQIIKNATLYAKTYISAEAVFEDILAWNERNNLKRKRHLHYKSPLQKSIEWFTLKPEIFTREPILKAA